MITAFAGMTTLGAVNRNNDANRITSIGTVYRHKSRKREFFGNGKSGKLTACIRCPHHEHRTISRLYGYFRGVAIVKPPETIPVEIGPTAAPGFGGLTTAPGFGTDRSSSRSPPLPQPANEVTREEGSNTKLDEFVRF